MINNITDLRIYAEITFTPAYWTWHRIYY